MVSKKNVLRAAVAAAAACTVPALAVAPAVAQVSSDTGVVINEIQPDGTDYIELANRNTAESVDISGWTLIDDKTDRTPYTFPEGTTIESGGYISIEPDADPDTGFGLGKKGDSVTLKNAAGEVMDTFTWTEAPTGTFSRIPDMTGDFVPTGEQTRDMINKDSAAADPVETEPFPGEPLEIKDQTPGEAFTAEDMSGIDFDAEGNAFVVNNGEGTLHKLAYDAATDTYKQVGQWTLKYADGTGTPDAEGVTVNPDGSVTVATERNNDDKKVSRPSLLRFEIPAEASGTIKASQEVSLKEIVGDIEPNSGLEAVEYIDELKAYAVGVESNGEVLVVTVDEAGTASLVQRYDSPFDGVMSLDYTEGVLRVGCDEVCEGQSIEMTIKDGKLVTDDTIYARPEKMANVANEGFASFVDASGTRYLWADDGVSDGVALRSAFVPASPLGSLEDVIGSIGGNGGSAAGEGAGMLLPLVGSVAVLGLGAGAAAFLLSNGMIPLPPIPAEFAAMLPPQLQAMLPQA